MALPTLGHHDSTREQLRGHCPACAHSSIVDVELLVRVFGAELPVTAVRPRLRCTRCGHLGGDVTIDAIASGPARARAVVVDRTPPWSPLSWAPSTGR